VSAVETVLGPADVATGIVEAHCHLYIDPPGPGPVLRDERVASAELVSFRGAGGTLVVDCQPGGAGRDGAALARISRSAGVHVVAATGYHLRQYHADGPPWSDVGGARERFERDLAAGLDEAPAVRAGVVKTAWVGDDPDEAELLRAAVAAANAHGRGMVVHTEPQGPLDALIEMLRDVGARPGRVQLSHVDKRPDVGLHRELAAAGYVLGYDTFLRPKYQPVEHVWPLLQAMLEYGGVMQITVGLDIVEPATWQACGGPGLRAIADEVIPRLRAIGADERAVARLTGGNALSVLG
jgi:predicted metal-dependent phosphotriesterase family hydrolase